MPQPSTTNVYELIAQVSGELAKTGISKDRQNVEQKYKFRGIDDVYNVLAPMLAKSGLVIIPRILTRSQTERTTKTGGALFNVVVEAEFDFVAAANPTSRHTARTFGEAMDTADKATNKAMSAAYKYAAFQTFCIPTEGDNDADATTHQVAAPVPAGYEDWLMDLEAVALEGLDALKAAWTKSPANLRKHLTDTDNVRWEGLKKRAAAVEPVHA